MVSIIYPTNIKKYWGSVCYHKGKGSWQLNITYKDIRYYKSFKIKEEGEEHLIEKNFEWDLPIKNIIYDHGDGILEMELTQKETTIFSRQDLELVQKHTWYYKEGYAKGGVDGINITLYNYLMNFTPTRHLSIDHINRDTLDNTRENLRIATRSEQNINQGMQKNNTSGVKGVCLVNNSYSARWCVNSNPFGKSFSINKYGEREAFKLACDFRKEMEVKYYS